MGLLTEIIGPNEDSGAERECSYVHNFNQESQGDEGEVQSKGNETDGDTTKMEAILFG